MRQLQLFQVDAFAEGVFRGNPAAVCPLDRWLEDAEMQAIAEENNLSETAFFVPRDGVYDLRWFTPRHEVNLCGHATLGSAFVIFEALGRRESVIRFETRSGTLEVSRDGEHLVMDFPANPGTICLDPPPALLEGLQAHPREVLRSHDDFFAVYEAEEDVRAIRPVFQKLEELDSRGVAVTAPGVDVDFVSRYFAPQFGIPEDPVTGSTHTTLVPYWSRRLGKTRLHARQISKRQGELFCENRGERVQIAGRAVMYLEGRIQI